MVSEIKKVKCELKRRALMQAFASLSLGMGVATPNFLSAESTSDQRKVVRIFLPGGMSQLDSFDPKPESPDVMGGTKTIKTNTGETISNFFPLLAKRMDKLTLIRSMVSTEADHIRAQYLNATSYPILGTTKHPDFGAWMKKMNGTQNDTLPASVKMGGPGDGGYLGTDYDPFSVSNAKAPLKGLIMENPDSAENIEFMKLMATIRKDFHKENRIKDVESYRSFYNDSISFMNSKDLVAFDISKESAASRKKYNIEYGSQLLLARRLLLANVQYVSMKVENWDVHYNTWNENNFPAKAKNLDLALTTFMDDLEAHGLLKNTVVNVITEFGRSPGLNKEEGRGHHRSSFCSFLFGAGVKKGLVYGKTNERSSKVIENPVTPQDLNATLAKLVGIDLEKEIYSPDNRPFTVARGGNPISDLLV